jgi:hypothetical protein
MSLRMLAGTRAFKVAQPVLVKSTAQAQTRESSSHRRGGRGLMILEKRAGIIPDMTHHPTATQQDRAVVQKTERGQRFGLAGNQGVEGRNGSLV